jgi:hypothetical protein
MWNIENYKDQLNYYIPKIDCPFGDIENENLRPTLAAHKKWLSESRMLETKEMVEKFSSLETYIVTAYLFPRNNEKDFILINKICDWLFIIDDVYWEPKKKDMDYINKLFDENAEHDAFGDVLWDVLNQWYKTNPKSGIDLFKQTLIDWAKYVINFNELDDKDVKNMPIEEYCKHRAGDVAGLVVLAGNMVDYDTFPEEILNTKEYIDLNYWYTVANTLINDIYSFKKESKSERLGNYVKIKTLQCGSIQEGMNHTRDYLEYSFKEITDLSNQLLKMFPNDKVLPIYIERLKESTGGDITAHRLSNRYSGNVYEREITRGSI